MQSCCNALTVGCDVWQTERERHTERGRERERERGTNKATRTKTVVVAVPQLLRLQTKNKISKNFCGS